MLANNKNDPTSLSADGFVLGDYNRREPLAHPENVLAVIGNRLSAEEFKAIKFAYSKVIAAIKSKSFKSGVEVIEVNPAYTSVIGAVNFAQHKGISVHMGAALVITRRGLKLSERVPKRGMVVPTRNGDHVTFCAPARNRRKHVWSTWAKVRTNLKAAHVAHYRLGLLKENPKPLSQMQRTLGSIWLSTAGIRGANRQQNCSADVMNNNPF